MLKNKKVFILLTTFILCIASTATAFATDSTSITAIAPTTTAIEITKDTLKLNKNEDRQIMKSYDTLAKELNTADDENIEQIIRNNTKNDLLTNKIETLSRIYKKENNATPHFSIQDSNLIKEYEFEDKNIEVGPHYVAIEEQTEESPQIQPLATKKTKGGRATRTYYAKPYGYKLFTVSVGMYFYYNGKKATYKSDFDAYYKRYLGGTLYSVPIGRKNARLQVRPIKEDVKETSAKASL